MTAILSAWLLSKSRGIPLFITVYPLVKDKDIACESRGCRPNTPFGSCSAILQKAEV